MWPHFVHRTLRRKSRRVRRRMTAWQLATCDWPPLQISRESPHRRTGRASPRRGPGTMQTPQREELEVEYLVYRWFEQHRLPYIPSCRNRTSPWCPRLSPSPRHRSPPTGEVKRLDWSLTAEKSGCGPEEGQRHIFNVSDLIRYVNSCSDFKIQNKHNRNYKIIEIRNLYVKVCGLNHNIYILFQVKIRHL